ncbi:FR47-like protein [Musa troglodytarum]|uniref:FR47-like protein n=1 Tax=Musa troglodytarum TaxID=320322 RepID=A0A9E7HER6_9LILI|nr:FR47-like protein [Musa troglodytarum]
MGAGGRGVEMAAAISLDGVRDKNVMQLKKLNTALFPVRYNDKYYADALASGDFTKLGTKLLSHVLDLSCKQNTSEVYLHVQTNNDDAIAFYKKFGFEIVDTIQNYYTNISPPHCYVLSKSIAQDRAKK